MCAPQPGVAFTHDDQTYNIAGTAGTDPVVGSSVSSEFDSAVTASDGCAVLQTDVHSLGGHQTRATAVRGSDHTEASICYEVTNGGALSGEHVECCRLYSDVNKTWG
jgi:hypothetical protein